MSPTPLTRQVALLLTAALGAAGGAGCGDVHGIPIAKTATDIGQAVCSSAYRCCTLMQLMDNGSAGTDATTCSTTNTAPCEKACETQTAEDFRNKLSAVQYSVDQKRAVYEQDKVDSCLAMIRSATCEMLNVTTHLTGVPGCESFVTPLVPLGGACGNDYECIGGFCKPPMSGGGEGVCTALATVGGSCADSNCAAGLTCDPKTSDATDDVCVQPGDTGAACTDPFECKSFSCTTSGGSGMSCEAPTGPMCFYSTAGCSAAGDGRPGLATVLLLAGFAVVALVRARRQRNRS